MDEQKVEDPLPKGAFKVGIVYNLKSGKSSDVPDEEAEYDSLDTVLAIKKELESAGHEVTLLEADQDFAERLKSSRIQIAFNIAEGRGGRGREAQVPAMLGFYKIAYTGSDETTLGIALDKGLTKKLLKADGIPTPDYVIVTKENLNEAFKLDYPVIVKPNAEGSSKGISDVCIARNEEELRQLLNKNLTIYNESMLVEEYIEGREFTVGVIGNGKDLKVFPPMEIGYKKTTYEQFHVYSYQVKQNYKEYVDYTCPAELSKDQEAMMMELTKKIFTSLACHDFSRVDYRMSADGRISFIEINPLPGLAPHYSDYPMLAEFSGMSYHDLVNGILQAAITRLGMKER